MAASAAPARKRWKQVAFWDGVTRANLQVVEDVLLRTGRVGGNPEEPHIRAATREVMKAKAIIQARVERRT